MFKICWRNITKRKFHTVLTLSMVALATAVLFSSLLLSHGVVNGINTGLSRLGADIIVTPLKEGEVILPAVWGGTPETVEQILFTGEPANIYMNKNVEQKVSKIPGVQQVTAQFFSQTLNESCCSLIGVNRLVGFNPDTDFVLKPWMETHLKGGLKKDQVIVGGFAPAPLGEKVTILGKTFTIADRLEPVGGSLDTSIFIPIEVARKLSEESRYLKGVWKDGKKPADLISTVLVKAASQKDVKNITDTINQIDGVKANAASEVVRSSKEQLSTLVLITGFLGAALWVVSLLGLIMTFAGGAVGLLLGAYLLFKGIDLILARTTYPFLLPTWEYIGTTAILALGSSLLVGFLASWYPAYRCARLDPVMAITEGELE